jgi:hypothetical protein
MKASVARADTARVLADIDDAVRPVERARTAAAVDRVLATASVAHGPFAGAHIQSYEICAVAGREPGHHTYCDTHCPDPAGCRSAAIEREDGHPGLAPARGAKCITRQRQTYAPWNVSPHLFPLDPER